VKTSSEINIDNENLEDTISQTLTLSKLSNENLKIAYERIHKEDKIILVLISAIMLFVILSNFGCSVTHKASGGMETNSNVTVTINYKNCDRPEWSSEDVIECIKEASSMELSTDDATKIYDLLKQQEVSP
jgi:hypothetical protein